LPDAFVIDCSVCLPWYVEDEASEFCDLLGSSLHSSEVWVPSLWRPELVTAVISAERRKRMTGEQRSAALAPAALAHDFPEPEPDPAPAPAAAGAVPPAGAAPTTLAVGGPAALEPAVPERRPRARRPAWVGGALSLAALVFLAAALLAAWRGGVGERVASSLLGREQVSPTVEPRRVTGGLYSVSGGARAFVVRGEVTARAAVAGPVRVQVELRRGGRTFASAEAMAGAAATPEEVWAAAAPGEAAALRRALDARAVRGLGPGATAPFLVVFVPPPDEAAAGAGELGLRVHAEPAPGVGP